MLGQIITWIALAGAIVSGVTYYQTALKKWSAIGIARRSFALMVASVIAASVLLIVYILRHQFEYAYIYSYSSKDLPTHLLVTTFWAGQEGSFLFWTLCGSIIGMFLLNYTRRHKIEYEVMSVYSLVQAFLLVLLISKSPFKYIWDANPDQVAVGSIPADGRGLNPLLQNIWMIIHPPVLFVGFAVMAVPFAFAVAALWRKTYSEWIPNALPWVIVGILWLGAGIMIGGYWAYGVLGWGGWWGWDPVENSSLIPWITGVALLHTLLVQKTTGNLARTSFFLAIMTFLLVVYSTFLTRSGVLGSASVHSFTDPGTFVYALLVVWLAVLSLLGFGLLAKRWNDLRALAGKVGMLTRESLISVGTAVMGASALIIFFGTSWPIIGNSSVEPSFYDDMNLPIAVALSVILGVSLLMMWRQESGEGFLSRAAFALGGSVLVTVLLVVAGLDDWKMGALAFASLFAFFVNLAHGYRVGKENLRFLGGPLAHIGLALLFLGIIGSGKYGQKQTASLPKGEAKEILGYHLTYVGSQPMDDGKWKFVVQAERDGKSFALEPVMFESSYNDQLMRNPDYISFLTKDFYIEPVSLEQADEHAHSHNSYQLKKGEAVDIADMKVTFLRFDMEQHGMEGMMTGNGFPVGAVLNVQRGGKTEQIKLITFYKETQQPDARTTMVKDGNIGLQMVSMNVDAETKTSSIQLSVIGLEEHAAVTEVKPEILVIEASMKPFIGLIWLAAVLMTFGLILSVVTKVQANRLYTAQQKSKQFSKARRQGEEKKEEEAAEPA